MDNHLDQELTGATRRNELFFWLFSIVALFLFLGHNALWASEDRWAEIAREMLITGDLLHPALNWQVYFDKPHLTYWLILPFAIVRGGFDEFIVRIPSALAGLAGLWGTLMLSKKAIRPPDCAAGPGWMLLTCYGFLFWARTAAADTANLAAIILAVAYFYQVEEKATFHRYLIFYLICFLGALAKGLPALVMPFVVIAPHLLAEKRWLKHLRVSNFLAFFLAAGLYFLPFYLASILPMEPPLRAQGNELSGLELVWRENIVRVFDAFDHKDPFYSYFYNLPRTLLPWVLVIGVSIAGMVRNWKKLPPPVRELMIGTLAMFVLFCCSTSRRWYYILPVMPVLRGAGGGRTLPRPERGEVGPAGAASDAAAGHHRLLARRREPGRDSALEPFLQVLSAAAGSDRIAGGRIAGARRDSDRQPAGRVRSNGGPAAAPHGLDGARLRDSGRLRVRLRDSVADPVSDGETAVRRNPRRGSRAVAGTDLHLAGRRAVEAAVLSGFAAPGHGQPGFHLAPRLHRGTDPGHDAGAAARRTAEAQSGRSAAVPRTERGSSGCDLLLRPGIGSEAAGPGRGRAGAADRCGEARFFGTPVRRDGKQIPQAFGLDAAPASNLRGKA